MTFDAEVIAMGAVTGPYEDSAVSAPRAVLNAPCRPCWPREKVRPMTAPGTAIPSFKQ
jgi:hypothetical protein